MTAVWSVSAFVVQTNAPKTFRPSNTLCHSAINTSNMWNGGNSYGKGQFKYYKDFDSWMSVFPEDDRKAFPEVFNLPKGVYEVKLNGPLGIVFEEIDFGKGLFVKDLVEGGNAAKQGTIELDDVLIGLTAVKVVGAKFERRLLPTFLFDFETMVSFYLHVLYLWITLISLTFLGCIFLTIVRPSFSISPQVGAIGSNNDRYGCEDVVLMFQRADEGKREEIEEFMSFFEPPFDNP